MEQAFDEAQARGEIGPYESFEPYLMVDTSSGHLEFPYWLSRGPQAKIEKLHKTGRCLDFTPGHAIARTADGKLHGLGWIRVTPDSGYIAQATLWSQGFRFAVMDLLEELIRYEVCQAAISQTAPMIPVADIENKIRDLNKLSEWITASSVAWPPDVTSV